MARLIAICVALLLAAPSWGQTLDQKAAPDSAFLQHAIDAIAAQRNDGQNQAARWEAIAAQRADEIANLNAKIADLQKQLDAAKSPIEKAPTP